ncbi:retinoic acid receptor responder protein 2 isoform X2 [Ascaphus truei]|uniref:retinoic acid receptor responder protein 2 isoform X2 n=1 Tax=Ascaphus truei TaxID=8439 RepID=UPI003F592EB5
MNTMAVALWLISMVLALGVKGQIPMGELSALQNTALANVIEDFHKKDHIQSGFQVSSVLKATEKFSTGIFVHLEFTLKQTNCKKQQGKGHDCNFITPGKTSNCFACFMFEYDTHEVLSQLIDCLPERHLKPQRVNKRTQSCREVEQTKGSRRRLPGTFSFLKSQ